MPSFPFSRDTILPTHLTLCLEANCWQLLIVYTTSQGEVYHTLLLEDSPPESAAFMNTHSESHFSGFYKDVF